MQIARSQVLLILAITLSGLAWSSDSSDSWETVREEDGITVLLRDVEGYDIKEFQGTTVLKTSVEQLLNHFMVTDPCTAWAPDPDCKSSYTVETISPTQFLQYTRLSMPWPMKDRDYVLSVQIEQNAETGEITLAFENIDHARQDDSCCARMRQYTGFWRLTPITTDSVQVTFQNHFNPGISVPSGMINSALSDWPIDTLGHLRGLVAS